MKFFAAFCLALRLALLPLLAVPILALPSSSLAAPGTDWSKYQNAPLYAQNQGVVNQFGVNNFYWGGTVVDEPVLITAKPGNYKLWRKPTSITRVVQYSSGQAANGPAYVAGVDYIMTADGITIPAGSAIVAAPAGFKSYVAPGNPYASQAKHKDGSPLRLDTDYVLYQIAVMYTTAPIVPPESNPLPRLAAALSNHTPLSIMGIGDSRMQGGGNTSQSLNLAPHQPTFLDLFGAYLSTASPGNVYWRNMAVSGWDANTAAVNVSRYLDSADDLVIIAFDVNDASGQVYKGTYKQAIRGIMLAKLAQNPNTEFILIAGYPSNDDWINYYPKFTGYKDVLHELAGEFQLVTNVAVADVQAIFDSIHRSKGFYDTTSNGVNHTYDFGHMVYTQTLIQLQLGAGP